MANSRVQHRHGTKAQLDANTSSILSDEIVIVDSGDDTEDGSAVYYKPNVTGATPKRLAQAGERVCLPRVIPSGTEVDDNLAGKLGEIVFSADEQSLYYLAGILGTEENPSYDWVMIADA